MSFRGDTSGGVAKCRLFSRAMKQYKSGGNFSAKSFAKLKAEGVQCLQIHFKDGNGNLHLNIGIVFVLL